MIKADSVGLEKADYNKGAFAEREEQRKSFTQIITEQHDQRIFDILNVPREHTREELIGLMRYKGVNIKAHVHPSIFFEVAQMLEDTNTDKD